MLGTNSCFAVVPTTLILPLSRSTRYAGEYLRVVRRLVATRETCSGDRRISWRCCIHLTGMSVSGCTAQAGDLPGGTVVNSEYPDRELSIARPTTTCVSKLNRLWRPHVIVHAHDTMAWDRDGGRFVDIPSTAFTATASCSAR